MGTFSVGQFLTDATHLDEAAARRQQEGVADQKAKIAPHIQALQALRTKQALLMDPKTGLPLKGNEQEYNQITDQMQANIHAMRDILHPPPSGAMGALDRFRESLTDRLHLTNSLSRANKDQNKQDAADEDDRKAVSTFQQGAPQTPAQQFTAQYQQATGRAPTQDELTTFAQRQGGITPTAQSFKPENIILKDGRTISAQYDSKSGRWLDLNQQPIPSDQLSGATLQTKTAIPKGLKFDAATGQIVDQDKGKRFNPNDPNNPPEVATMFKQQAGFQAKKEAFQEKMMGIRESGYAQARQMTPLNVLDTWKGNAPTFATYKDMLKNPGRYVPSGEADKAIAKENLMQDISGSSRATRTAIENMKEDFPEDMKAKIAVATRAENPASALDQLFASGALGSLTPDQQDVYVAVQQLAEQGMAMRSVLGAGTGSDTMRAAMRSTLPSLLTPDKAFANKQLDAFDATVKRLHRGVNRIKLNDEGQSYFTVYVPLPNGTKKTYHFPSETAANQFKIKVGIK